MIATEEWVEVGAVGVDTGTVMIADPCYAEDMAKQVIVAYEARENFADTTEWGFHGREKDGVAGVISTTGIGDGCFPVYVKRDAEGNVVALMIDFRPTD